MTNNNESRTEKRKATIDYLKHLSTLCSASILLIVTFLEKLSKHPKSTWLVEIAVCSFLIALISAMVSYTLLIAWWGNQTGPFFRRFGLMLTMSWGTFLIGVAAIVAFAVRNL